MKKIVFLSCLLCVPLAPSAVDASGPASITYTISTFEQGPAAGSLSVALWSEKAQRWSAWFATDAVDRDGKRYLSFAEVADFTDITNAIALVGDINTATRVYMRVDASTGGYVEFNGGGGTPQNSVMDFTDGEHYSEAKWCCDRAKDTDGCFTGCAAGSCSLFDWGEVVSVDCVANNETWHAEDQHLEGCSAGGC